MYCGLTAVPSSFVLASVGITNLKLATLIDVNCPSKNLSSNNFEKVWVPFVTPTPHWPLVTVVVLVPLVSITSNAPLLTDAGESPHNNSSKFLILELLVLLLSWTIFWAVADTWRLAPKANNCPANGFPFGWK